MTNFSDEILKKTIAQSILEMPTRRHNPVAIQFKKNQQWVQKSWPEYYSDILAVACGIHQLNIKKGERIAILSATRYEWTVSDLAIFSNGAVTVPIYPNSTPDDILYILNDSEAKVLFIGSKNEEKLWKQVADKCPHVKHVFYFDEMRDHPRDLHWASLIDKGRHQKKSEKHILDQLGTLRSDDMATLLYTSGTTGKPKGVVLNHLQVISEVSEAFPLCGATAADTSLCFLPLAHVLGRIEHWGHVYIGHTMAFAESIEKVKENLLEIRPTFLMSVPRIFEKIHSAILASVHSNQIKKRLFDWAVNVGYKVSDLRLTRQIIPLPLLAEYELARKLVLQKVTQAFGGRLRFAISGGAPLAREISQFFHAADVLILEGYGLTETTAAITVNTPFNYRFGSVGRPIGEVQIKIADDGEILVKSHKVMHQYYKNPGATKEVFTDGWFHTGDIGIILPGGDLKITDRKKDLIKTAGGKYVAPQRLEGLLKLHPIIAQALIHGDQKKYIVALLTLEPAFLKEWAQTHNISFTDWKELCSLPQIEDLVRKVIAEANAELASFESIKKFKILPVEFTIEDGDLTPSLKLKRKVLDAKYIKEIESLYE